MTGAMSGAYLETFIINEIIKSYVNFGKEPEIYFFRDSNGVEIDIMIYENGTLYPLEINSTSNPTSKMVKAFDIIATIPEIKRGEGGVICLTKELLPLKNSDKIIPVWVI
jgi:predicted AAA+ superfamily ATPase